MVTFDIKDYDKIVLTDKLEQSLNEYNGTIPILLKPFLDLKKYDENLKKNGSYDNVYEEYYAIRLSHLKAKDKDKFREKELISWLKENPNFDELLNDSISK